MVDCPKCDHDNKGWWFKEKRTAAYEVENIYTGERRVVTAPAGYEEHKPIKRCENCGTRLLPWFEQVLVLSVLIPGLGLAYLRKKISAALLFSLEVYLLLVLLYGIGDLLSLVAVHVIGVLYTLWSMRERNYQSWFFYGIKW